MDDPLDQFQDTIDGEEPTWRWESGTLLFKSNHKPTCLVRVQRAQSSRRYGVHFLSQRPDGSFFGGGSAYSPAEEELHEARTPREVLMVLAFEAQERAELARDELEIAEHRRDTLRKALQLVVESGRGDAQ